jgi:hypothetical protein
VFVYMSYEVPVATDFLACLADTSILTMEKIRFYVEAIRHHISLIQDCSSL